jgi:hypothetical protein
MCKPKANHFGRIVIAINFSWLSKFAHHLSPGRPVLEHA